ncbi:metal ABC transporter permease [Candidatus Dependentiae bacterium]|nr:metal ABC transporter permease [Candidatus Dependentiae bacterium]
MEILEYEFIQNALIAVLLLSICCGIIGTYIVIRRMVFISDGIAHTVFGGIGIAHYFKLNIFAGAFLFGIISTVLFEYIVKRFKERTDTIIGIILAAGMAVGVIFINLTPGYSGDLFSYLFGNILMVKRSELIFISVFNLILIIFTTVYFQVIKSISFDEDFAIISELPVKFIDFCMMIFITLSIILLIKAVGIILVIAMLTIPPSIANNFFNDLKKIMIFSVIIGMLFGIAGLYFSYIFDLPAGAIIIVIAALSYFLLFVKKIIFKN